MMMRFLLFLAALPLMLASLPAKAACDASNTYRFAFSSVATASLNYANSYSYTATNTLGATRPFTLSFTSNGLSSNVVNSVALPAIGNLITSGTGANTLVVGGIFSGRTTSITSTTRVITVTFTFTQPVRDFAFTVHDADYTLNQYRDWVHISGSNGVATYTPTMTTPYGTSNLVGALRSIAASSLTLGSATTPFNLTAFEELGVGQSDNNNVTTGDVVASFAEPVTSITMRYGNYPYQTGENTTGQQGMGISALSFCPMPALAVTKTSAPYATSGPDRFNAPGSDVAYTLTVTNSGGSAVDVSSLVLTDVLPAGLTFYNGDYDPAVPGTGPFQLTAGTSGVTLPAAGRAYSNNGGSTYVYTPAAGYDANVNAVRLTPTGSMAANSSFTIRFRARVN